MLTTARDSGGRSARRPRGRRRRSPTSSTSCSTGPPPLSACPLPVPRRAGSAPPLRAPGGRVLCALTAPSFVRSGKIAVPTPPRTGSDAPTVTRVAGKDGVVLAGHSAGSLYARMHAYRFRAPPVHTTPGPSALRGVAVGLKPQCITATQSCFPRSVNPARCTLHQVPGADSRAGHVGPDPLRGRRARRQDAEQCDGPTARRTA